MFYDLGSAQAHGYGGLERGARDFLIIPCRIPGTRRQGFKVRFVF